MEYFLLLGSHDNLLGVSVDGGLFNRIFSAFGAAVLPPRSCSPCYILGKYSLEYRVEGSCLKRAPFGLNPLGWLIL